MYCMFVFFFHASFAYSSCRSIKNNTSTSKGMQPNSIIDDQLEGPSRKSRAYIKFMFTKHRSGTSQSLQVTRERSVSELAPDEQLAKYLDGFRYMYMYIKWQRHSKVIVV